MWTFIWYCQFCLLLYSIYKTPHETYADKEETDTFFEDLIRNVSHVSKVLNEFYEVFKDKKPCESEEVLNTTTEYPGNGTVLIPYDPNDESKEETTTIIQTENADSPTNATEVTLTEKPPDVSTTSETPPALRMGPSISEELVKDDRNNNKAKIVLEGVFSEETWDKIRRKSSVDFRPGTGFLDDFISNYPQAKNRTAWVVETENTQNKVSKFDDTKNQPKHKIRKIQKNIKVLKQKTSTIHFHHIHVHNKKTNKAMQKLKDIIRNQTIRFKMKADVATKKSQELSTQSILNSEANRPNKNILRAKYSEDCFKTLVHKCYLATGESYTKLRKRFNWRNHTRPYVLDLALNYCYYVFKDGPVPLDDTRRIFNKEKYKVLPLTEVLDLFSSDRLSSCIPFMKFQYDIVLRSKKKKKKNDADKKNKKGKELINSAGFARACKTVSIGKCREGCKATFIKACKGTLAIMCERPEVLAIRKRCKIECTKIFHLIGKKVIQKYYSSELSEYSEDSRSKEDSSELQGLLNMTEWDLLN